MPTPDNFTQGKHNSLMNETNFTQYGIIEHFCVSVDALNVITGAAKLVYLFS